MQATASEALMTQEQRQIWEVIESFNQAFAANDVELYFSFIDPEISVFIPGSPYRIEGLHDDREAFEYGLHAGHGRVGYFQELQPQIRVSGELALVTYHSRGSYGPEGGQQTRYLKETDVLIKRGGSWKIVHVHVSSA